MAKNRSRKRNVHPLVLVGAGALLLTKFAYAAAATTVGKAVEAVSEAVTKATAFVSDAEFAAEALPVIAFIVVPCDVFWAKTHGL